MCVKLAFFHEGVKTNIRRTTQCANPNMAVASSACCVGANTFMMPKLLSCNFFNERMKYETAKSRCANLGGNLCDSIPYTNNPESLSCGRNYPSWTNKENSKCYLKVKVNRLGQVAILDYGPEENVKHSHGRLRESNNFYYFNVMWQNEAFGLDINNFPKAEINSCKYPKGEGYINKKDARTKLQCTVRSVDNEETNMRL